MRFLIVLIPLLWLAAAVVWLFFIRAYMKVTKQFSAMMVASLTQMDALCTGLSRLLGEAATLTRGLRDLYDAERGIAEKEPYPPGFPQYPPGQLSEMDTQSRIDAIKARARELRRKHLERGDRHMLAPWDNFPDVTAECRPCDCTVTGWDKPHCHYHIAAIPDMTRCPVADFPMPR